PPQGERLVPLRVVHVPVGTHALELVREVVIRHWRPLARVPRVSDAVKRVPRFFLARFLTNHDARRAVSTPLHNGHYGDLVDEFFHHWIAEWQFIEGVGI